jgi:hypothetical protein
VDRGKRELEEESYDTLFVKDALSYRVPTSVLPHPMDIVDGPIRIDPPLYLASTTVACWRCGAAMPAVALVAPNVPDADGEACVLSEVRELPESVLSFIQARFPTFQRKYSKTVGYEYFANTCRRCGVLYGDFYLYDEPGAPFFPTCEEEARSVCLQEVAVAGPIWIRARLGTGTADMILSGARRVAQNKAMEADANRSRG